MSHISAPTRGHITLTDEQWDTVLTLAEAAPLLDRQPNTLRHHALAGHLRTVQIARRHFTTMRWLGEYMAATGIDLPSWWPAARHPPTAGDRIILPVPPTDITRHGSHDPLPRSDSPGANSTVFDPSQP